jgi:hypothetical protein
MGVVWSPLDLIKGNQTSGGGLSRSAVQQTVMLRSPEGRTSRSTDCHMRRPPNKKTKSTPARLALLHFTPARLARLSSRMWRLTASPTRCGMRQPASRGSAVAGPPKHAATCESRCSVTGPARRCARPLPPCPVT